MNVYIKILHSQWQGIPSIYYYIRCEKECILINSLPRSLLQGTLSLDFHRGPKIGASERFLGTET